MHQASMMIASLIFLLVVVLVPSASSALLPSFRINCNSNHGGERERERERERTRQLKLKLQRQIHQNSHYHAVVFSMRGGGVSDDGNGGDATSPQRSSRKKKKKTKNVHAGTRTRSATSTSSGGGNTVQSKKKRRTTRRRSDEDDVAVVKTVDDEDDDNDVDGTMIVKGKKKLRKAIKDDPSTMMGDAIRSRSSELLQDNLDHPRTTTVSGGASQKGHDHANVGGRHPQRYSKRGDGDNPAAMSNNIFTSLSYSIGTSDDRQMAIQQQRQKNIDEEGGGVEPNSSAVIANYFLKSHGGMHGLQSITSVLAVLFGLGSFACPSNKPSLRLRLLQRCLISALAKHLSGFLGVASLSAGSIPEIGWRETRRRVEDLVLDPVAQYLFYCALLIVWSNNSIRTTVAAAAKAAAKAKKGAAATKTAAAAVSDVIIPWWLNDNKLCMICLLGPILLREIVSFIWVAADVLVLYHSARSTETTPATLKVGKGAIDAMMSLLLTPTQWRNANPAQKQKMLAQLVGKTSLGLEVGTCIILIVDALRAFVDYSISPMESRPGLLLVAKRVICARLMINFMLVRRKKVVDLVGNIRGGARHIPGRVLDCLLEPGKAMGLGSTGGADDEEVKKNPKTFSEWVVFLLGF